MNVQDLRTELRRRRVYDRDVVLDALSDAGADAAEGAVYVTQADGTWEVGVQERGRREAYATFADEDGACRYALEVLAQDAPPARRSWWSRWS